jgi:DNA-binding protein HU-beta
MPLVAPEESWIMTKTAFIDAVCQAITETALSKRAASALVDAVFATMSHAVVTEGRFAYPGFGTFTVRERAARPGRNPQTGQPITIQARKTVGFRPASALKDRLQ